MSTATAPLARGTDDRDDDVMPDPDFIRVDLTTFTAPIRLPDATAPRI